MQKHDFSNAALPGRPHLTRARLVGALVAALALGVLAAPAARAQAAAVTEGEVRKIDRDAGKITLRHGEIPNLEMPPMTMVFRVQDRTALDRLKVGDPVRFTADKIGGQYTVTSIEARK